jgi:DNA-binding beta-propeller fold protein YncE
VKLLFLALLALVSCSTTQEDSETVRSAEQADVPAYDQSFTTFESGQVRPLALTPDRKTVLAVNTPDARLEVFSVTPAGLTHVTSVSVGLEPVAVVARTNDEAWVVNHLSDSVSVVKIDGATSYVRQTVLVGDEPRDVVVAGANRSRVFVTTAHRGQNNPNDPQLTTPGVGRADVWVLNAATRTVESIVTLFADTPRALAATPDGSKVYAAAFHSGNRTAIATSIALPPPLPLLPATNAFLEPYPIIPPGVPALIVTWDGQHWLDERGLVHDLEMRFRLPDKDVFEIDADAAVPVETRSFSSVGTVLFNMAVNPASGKVYVSNIESNNQQRFEGPNEFGASVTLPDASVRGRIAQSRISVLGQDGSVSTRHLNKHIDYSACCAPVPNAESVRSLAFPTGIEVSASGQTLYAAALGSSKVGVYQTSALENDTFVPSLSDQIPVTGGGPTGLALDDAAGRLYVMTRFDNSISVVDTAARAEVAHVAMYNPEPPKVTQGRRFLYDASNSSSHGDQACASCHIFGDMDDLGWDLGNPDAEGQTDPNPYANPTIRNRFNALKGIMTTQSLRGMANHGPMHWRGDRTEAFTEPSVQPDSGAYNEQGAFKRFNPAFMSLLGRSEELPAADMQAFTDFVLEIMYPPNPIRALDNSLTPEQQAGRDFYFNRKSLVDLANGGVLAPHLSCNDCHVLDPHANEGATDKPGFFGTDGRSADILAPQNTKTPHLRNQYQKIGMFGYPLHLTPPLLPSDASDMGDQIRGFGFFHDGNIDTEQRFFTAANFAGLPVVNPEGFASLEEQRQVEAFMLAFDSNFAPIVGQQMTLTSSSGAAENARVDLILARADAGECDAIWEGADRNGFLYSGGTFLQSRANVPALTVAQAKALAQAAPFTLTAVPRGNGRRLALDRDLDGALDGDEQDAGTDPADPYSHP